MDSAIPCPTRVAPTHGCALVASAPPTTHDFGRFGCVLVILWSIWISMPSRCVCESISRICVVCQLDRQFFCALVRVLCVVGDMREFLCLAVHAHSKPVISRFYSERHLPAHSPAWRRRVLPATVVPQAFYKAILDAQQKFIFATSIYNHRTWRQIIMD